MKYERLILFPYNDLIVTTDPPKPDPYQKELLLGATYVIGQASSAYYRYVSPVMFPRNMSPQALQNFMPIEGALTIVTSILQMRNGENIAVLRPLNDRPFLKKFHKLFVLADKALSTHELLPSP
ncbi:MAG: hypothetical protein WA810_07205 [Maribacter sp.]